VDNPVTTADGRDRAHLHLSAETGSEWQLNMITGYGYGSASVSATTKEPDYLLRRNEFLLGARSSREARSCDFVNVTL